MDEMANSLEKLLEEARDKCAQVEVTYDYLFKLIKRFLLIVSRVARLLECIEFDPLEFYFLIDSTEQQARQQAIKTDLPKYIFSKLGIGKDPFEKFNNENKLLALNSRSGDFNDGSSDYYTSSDLSLPVNLGGSSNIVQPTSLEQPCEEDFEKIKLISNGAYGAVYLVRHRQLSDRFAMKKIKKHNIILRNQVQQVSFIKKKKSIK